MSEPNPPLPPELARQIADRLAARLRHGRLLDSSNQFYVRRSFGGIVFETNTAARILCAVTIPQALNLSGWLQCLADPGGEEIARLVKEIKQ